jgi:hypothetical protein
MTEMMKQNKKKGDEIWEAYDKILSTSPSPLDGATKNLVFIWMYFFVQGNIEHRVFTKQLIDIGINPLDVSYFVEELELQKKKLKKNVLPIQYVSQ